MRKYRETRREVVDRRLESVTCDFCKEAIPDQREAQETGDQVHLVTIEHEWVTLLENGQAQVKKMVADCCGPCFLGMIFPTLKLRAPELVYTKEVIDG